ncbi:lipoprotein ABC transporter ATP-binding protein LolD [Photobacterium proteolyticum]|uniref:Lipoprotein ABC transporter ATP-binding protein LolD n=1 Tax=Photobacterium proteolyticum TaxID=1903952 RepID=A0A1Q9GIL1_9GAMM|nr:ABC transporter ATP-binding protein [Photobacterium proteolyticum]OLQ74296.1 lipoprotein ABC transporter ATP-binding protein LolD [Photobacterium proteolyticum]
MIQFSGIRKQYWLGNQEVCALNGVSGVIDNGEMVALCGPSGSGKSTLLNILGLLDRDYQGEVLFGETTSALQPAPQSSADAARFRRSQLGFVFQRFNLVPVMTALENVAYPLHLNGCSKQEQQQKATEMLERVGLGKWLHHRPDHLSGGQQQRVAIARALVHRPSLVIADEPTASLDSQTANAVVEIMKDLGHEIGTTFIVATHDPRMAERCDRRIELLDGYIQQEAMRWVS